MVLPYNIFNQVEREQRKGGSSVQIILIGNQDHLGTTSRTVAQLLNSLQN